MKSMEIGLPASVHGDLGRRAAPIACGAALAASAAFLATHDPGAAGSRYPSCVFHQMTGLWCPGCGLTRGTYQLLHGHVGAALGYNVFTPLALVAIVVGLVCVATRLVGRDTDSTPETGRSLARRDPAGPGDRLRRPAKHPDGTVALVSTLSMGLRPFGGKLLRRSRSRQTGLPGVGLGGGAAGTGEDRVDRRQCRIVELEVDGA